MPSTTPISAEPPLPRHVLVYGNDHSPWVQAVLLGLHEKGIDHTLVLAPPLSVFVRSGVLMPAARIDDGPWALDSERILVSLGFSGVTDDERRALQTVFGAGALRRTDDAWAFWRRFSFVRDGARGLLPRLWHQFWRAFSIFYFFVLIRLLGRRLGRATRAEIVEALARWQGRLDGAAPFFGGTTPDTVDLQLFGLVQMYGSIPGPPLEALRDAPELERLRAWVSAMQQRFDTYDHLYTATVFEPRCAPIRPAPLAERLAYWLGAATMWLALPITTPLALYFASRVRRTGMLRDGARRGADADQPVHSQA